VLSNNNKIISDTAEDWNQWSRLSKFRVVVWTPRYADGAPGALRFC